MIVRLRPGSNKFRRRIGVIINGIVHIFPACTHVNLVIFNTETRKPGKERCSAYKYGLIRRAGSKGLKALNGKFPDITAEYIALCIFDIDSPVVPHASNKSLIGRGNLWITCKKRVFPPRYRCVRWRAEVCVLGAGLDLAVIFVEVAGVLGGCHSRDELELGPYIPVVAT